MKAKGNVLLLLMKGVNGLLNNFEDIRSHGVLIRRVERRELCIEIIVVGHHRINRLSNFF